MKRFQILLGLVLLIGFVISVNAQEVGTYGLPLEITIPYDVDSLFDKFRETNSAEDYDLYEKWSEVKWINCPIWSPDGKWIVFSTIHRIWIVSADGGIPSVLYEDYQYELNYKHFYNPLYYISFTPDGQEVTFSRNYWDEEKGSVVEITQKGDNGYSAQFENGMYNIESINIYTGEHRVIAEGNRSVWSHNGRYLCYMNFDYRKYFDDLLADHDEALTVLDTVTGEKWFLMDGPQRDSTQYVDGTERPFSYHFTSDDSAVNVKTIIYSSDGERTYGLIQIPITGGERQPYTAVPNSPDGQWRLFTDYDETKGFSYSGTDETALYGGTVGASSNVFLHNVESGDTYKLFPDAYETLIECEFASFSPDGTKICYQLSNYNIFENDPHIYIMDMDIDSFQKIVSVEAETPESFILLSNYPNPFNPLTTIQFTLPEAGFTELVIYNSMGQKVRTLVTEYMPAGVHSAVWDGRDASGEPVSSGVFVTRLTSGDNVVSNRMMLVK
ncbi:FlgD immunoglobulin-like domain containing protein [Candidatus Latescibacterota bacterium]